MAQVAGASRRAWIQELRRGGDTDSLMEKSYQIQGCPLYAMATSVAFLLNLLLTQFG